MPTEIRIGIAHTETHQHPETRQHGRYPSASPIQRPIDITDIEAHRHHRSRDPSISTIQRPIGIADIETHQLRMCKRGRKGVHR